jgi:hypothetical protein
VEKLANANLVQWSACLNFEMDKDALGDLEKYDICQFIGQYKGEVKFQLYFDCRLRQGWQTSLRPCNGPAHTNFKGSQWSNLLPIQVCHWLG